MMLIGSIAAIVLTWLTGHALVAWLRGNDARMAGDRVLDFFMSMGVGLCLSSFGFFAARLLNWTSLPSVLAFDLLILVAVVLLRWCVPSERSEPAGSDRPVESAPVAMRRLLQLALGVSAIAAIVLMSTLYTVAEFGFWDAFAIWNLKAKFLMCEGPVWQQVFSDLISWSHTDYPLLLPLNVARLWVYAGEPACLVSAGVSILFTMLIVGVLYAGVARVRGRVQGCLAALALLATSGFIRQGTNQVADLPVAFFLLAAFCALSLSFPTTSMSTSPDEGTRPGRHVVLTGLLIGAAAWTKNEGALIALALLAGTFLVTLRNGGMRRAASVTGVLLLGLALPLVCLATLKLGFAGRSDLIVEPGTGTVLERMVDGSRHWTILTFAGGLIWDWVGGTLLVVLLVFAVASGPVRDNSRRPLIAAVAITVFLTVAGYYVVFLLTPRDPAVAPVHRRGSPDGPGLAECTLPAVHRVRIRILASRARRSGDQQPGAVAGVDDSLPPPGNKRALQHNSRYALVRIQVDNGADPRSRRVCASKATRLASQGGGNYPAVPSRGAPPHPLVLSPQTWRKPCSHE